MAKIVCSICKKVHDHVHDGKCPVHPHQPDSYYDFQNSDDFLQAEVKRVGKEHEELGLTGLVGGLQAIVINTEPDNLKKAAQELLNYTGYEFDSAFEDEEFVTCVLKLHDSADILLRNRKAEDNPFREFNLNPKSKSLPNTRLETFIFATNDLQKYHNIQKNRKKKFIQKIPIINDNFRFIQSVPSQYTGVSVGIIQWSNQKKNYQTFGSRILDWNLLKPKKDYLKNIGFLDHIATRVRARDRDAAIIEFMELTNYHFDFAIYVKLFNSITNVARLSSKDFTMVFTSGIVPFISLEESGPTEKFIYNYGTRTHHLAFVTENIETVYDKLKEDGMEYLVNLLGSPDEGLKQTFTVGSPNTLLVNEYIHRYGNFTGFFTKQNVTLLTKSTEKQ